MDAADSWPQALGLSGNPFPVATTGAAFVPDLALPGEWESELRQRLDDLGTSRGSKALLIVGGYGSGKTFILNWIARKYFAPQRIQHYFFDNPGVAFYSLANRLMRQVGRYELSKGLWEILYHQGQEESLQPDLFQPEFPGWLGRRTDRQSRDREVQTLARAMQALALATDEEIAHKFARVVVETRDRPYYEYRDFVPRTAGALVAEQEEANYFRTLIRILLSMLPATGIALLIDEFEDVTSDRRLTKRQATEYASTLRQLLDTAREEEFWTIISSTLQGLEQTKNAEPALMERFGEPYTIPPLTEGDARRIIVQRLNTVRDSASDDLRPFPGDMLSVLRTTTWSSPRRLIKVSWHALARASRERMDAPIPVHVLRESETRLFGPEAAEA